MMKVYRVYGKQEVIINKWVKAESESEALEIVNDMDIELSDFADGTVGISDYGDCEATEVSECGGYVEWEGSELDEDHEYDESTDKWSYEIIMDGNVIHREENEEYDTEEDAEDAACDYISDYAEDNGVDEDDLEYETFIY